MTTRAFFRDCIVGGGAKGTAPPFFFLFLFLLFVLIVLVLLFPACRCRFWIIGLVHRALCFFPWLALPPTLVTYQKRTFSSPDTPRTAACILMSPLTFGNDIFLLNNCNFDISTETCTASSLSSATIEQICFKRLCNDPFNPLKGGVGQSDRTYVISIFDSKAVSRFRAINTEHPMTCKFPQSSPRSSFSWPLRVITIDLIGQSKTKLPTHYY